MKLYRCMTCRARNLLDDDCIACRARGDEPNVEPIPPRSAKPKGHPRIFMGPGTTTRRIADLLADGQPRQPQEIKASIQRDATLIRHALLLLVKRGVIERIVLEDGGCVQRSKFAYRKA